MGMARRQSPAQAAAREWYESRAKNKNGEVNYPPPLPHRTAPDLTVSHRTASDPTISDRISQTKPDHATPNHARPYHAGPGTNLIAVHGPNSKRRIHRHFTNRRVQRSAQKHDCFTSGRPIVIGAR